MRDELKNNMFRNLEEIEAAAEKVLADEQKLTLFEINSRKTQEALNRLGDAATPNNVWTCLSKQFFSFPREPLKRAFRSDLATYKAEIDVVRDEIKSDLNFLRELEGKEALKGFNLQPLSREELTSVTYRNL